MSNFLNNFPDILNGVYITVLLMVATIATGLVLAAGMTIGSLASTQFVKKPIDMLIFFVRGTPLLVQLFLIYFGLGQFEWIRSSFLWVVLREPMACAIIALSINTACYTSILLKGAIQSVPKNEIAACEALGMSKWLAMRRIIFPLAFRIALPAYSNEVIIVLKCTSLASTITLLDLMGVTQQLVLQTFRPVSLYVLAGTIYLTLTFFLMMIFKLIEKKFALPEQAN